MPEPSPTPLHLLVRAAPLDATAGLDELWEQCSAAGTFAPAGERAVLRIAGRSGDSLLEATAHSLRKHLERQGVWRSVDVERSDDAVPTEEWIRLASSCLAGGTPLPRVAFDDFDVITVCRPRSVPHLAHSSVLAAQAESLRWRGIRRWALAREAIFEAHRLHRSDAAVVCGPLVAGRDRGALFWAASSSDLVLEEAIARAAGARFERLPHVRYLGRRRLLSPVEPAGVEIPELRGYRASAATAAAAAAIAGLARRLVLAVDELRQLRTQATRVAAAVRRRLGFGPGT